MRCTAPPENMSNMPRMPFDWPWNRLAKAAVSTPGIGM